MFLRYFIVFIVLLSITSCKHKPPAPPKSYRPQRTLTSYFDSKYLLYALSGTAYKEMPLQQSFKQDIPVATTASGLHLDFKPLGYDASLNLQYTHIYSPECVYHRSDSLYKYAEVCFPNTCLTRDMAFAQVKLTNTTDQPKHLYLRLCYQNTSYWFRTDDSLNRTHTDYLDNYYGVSKVVATKVAAHSQVIVKVPYTIGLDPKGDFFYDPSKAPARPGNYEFMLLYAVDTAAPLLHARLDLKATNPFAAMQLLKGQKGLLDMTYIGAHHFKFVFLDEYFDGLNDLNPKHVWIAKNGREKKLCDTCTGWYKEVISEEWNNHDFYKGVIANAPIVKADYGIKRENTRIDSTGITLTIPKSTLGNYKKTWGEILFGPSFKYGHVTVRAKFAPMFNTKGYPTGIIHNLWLYQRDPDPVDTTNPYHYLVNSVGKQPYEIDFELWTCMEGFNTMWDDKALIYYSIVDYMRNPNISIKPGDRRTFGNYKTERSNGRQVGIPSTEIPKEFFDSFHTYELYWYPDHVRYLLDGTEVAMITNEMAKIPDTYMFLWIGSPLYQDGTFYSQVSIPFLRSDKQTVIDYIKIE